MTIDKKEFPKVLYIWINNNNGEITFVAEKEPEDCVPVAQGTLTRVIGIYMLKHLARVSSTVEIVDIDKELWDEQIDSYQRTQNDNPA